VQNPPDQCRFTVIDVPHEYDSQMRSI